MKQSGLLKKMTLEEFYLLEAISIESDGFYYVDEEN